MKQILKKVSYGDYEGAKLLIKSNAVKGNFLVLQDLLTRFSDKPVTSPDAEILRLLFYHNYLKLISEAENAVIEVEKAMVTTKGWKALMTFVEDAPLTMQGLGCLLIRIYDNIDVPEARKVMIKYHELYDINKVEWPGDVREVMQEVAAEIAIKDSVS